MTIGFEVVEWGKYQTVVEAGLDELSSQHILPRIWSRDHTVWRSDPTEIANRLGWLDIADRMQEHLPTLEALRDALVHRGYTDALLLGMGGSSLAPEVFSKVFGDKVTGLSLSVLDSTDPGAVLDAFRCLNLQQTLFVVSTKSGGTVETLSFFKFFYNRMLQELGDESGMHFVAITDPGSKLTTLSKLCNFRETFLNDPNIGGRYSVLSYFGLLPASLVGVDLSLLLERARAMMAACGPDVSPGENPAARLGTILGELAKAGRDKMTLVASPEIASFGDWVEQLVAESTGKEGKGILPVIGEPLVGPDLYGDDRLFVHLRLEGDTSNDAALELLARSGYPVIRIPLTDRYDLGGQFFLWKLATAIAGVRMDIQPFDQPNVEAAKRRAKEMITAYQQEGTLPKGKVAPLTSEVLLAFLAGATPGDYVAIQAYVQPTPEIDAALQSLRTHILEHTHLATTVGYGPRFLHSTGQLHKGDAGNGLFIQLTSDPERDLPIPDAPGPSASSVSFGVLKMAQALGDQEALLDVDRRVIHFYLGTQVTAGIRKLDEFLS